MIVEETVRVDGGRVREALGTAPDGGRVFAVTVIQPGVSTNGVHYPEATLAAGVRLYEGAKAFDHHRTDEELKTSTVVGIVGHYEGVTVGPGGSIQANLHLLPSARHVAEALDASLAAQGKGLPPVVGISHDVQAVLVAAEFDGRKVREATQIVRVLSADVVADPAAGGHAVRAVAGGSGAADPQEDAMPATLAELLASASDEDKATLRALLGTADPEPAPTDPDTPADPEAPAEPEGVLVSAGGLVRGSAMADIVVRELCATAGLAGAERVVSEVLPARFTEADVKAAVATAQKIAEGIEKRGLTPTVPHVQVGSEEKDRRITRLDRTLEGNYREGYRSFRQIAQDWLPGVNVLDEDVPRALLREAYVGASEMRRPDGLLRARESGNPQRVSEAIISSTFGEALGDSITRRLIGLYDNNPLMNWKEIISGSVPINDFRVNRRVRMGGYGNLPAVAEAANYTALTSPTDEEATYAVTKRGGTENLTLEAITNDDIGALQRIPQELSVAAAQTIHDFVWNFLVANGNIYDGTALFLAGHNNTAVAALSNAALSAARVAMRKQTRYGAATQRLNFTPKYLVVPAELEETAWTLVTSAVNVVAAANATVPNLHQGMTLIIDPSFADVNDWFVIADPSLIPTIELGYLGGREEPELFVQDMGNVGSMFNNDSVTWKIRHIYGAAVLDFRGFYRGTQP